MRAAVGVVSIALLVDVVLGGASAAAQEAWPPPECVAADAITDVEDLATDTVACLAIDSAAVGGALPVSYHLPAACTEDEPCPVLYLLHGFSGTYTSMLGTADAPTGWVAALTSTPPVDPGEVDDPWSYHDPAGWVSAPPLEVILVAPHGRTVPRGHGPDAHLDSFWTDWNPRYASGGEAQSYDTPPPRFGALLSDELIPFVDAVFPTRRQRGWRGISGVSLGGYGAYLQGLRQPDAFATIGSVSGAMNFLFAPPPGEPLSLPLPSEGGTVLPGLLGGAPLPPGPAQGFAVAFTALGDPVADQPYYRGNMPVDLARNGRAFAADGAPAVHLRSFVNDAVPRRGEDLADPPSYFGAQAFESIVLPMNLEQDEAFEAAGVTRTFEIHPGLHSGVYWNPWLREHLEAQAAYLHPDGDPPPLATTFDHRSIEASYEVWGWGFDIADRNDPQFLDLADVSCEALTLTGTGTVTVTVPSSCATGLDGARTFDVDLGASGALVLPTGIDLAARTVTLELDPLPAAPDDPPPSAPDSSAPDGALPTTGGGGGAALAALAILAALCSRYSRFSGTTPDTEP